MLLHSFSLPKMRKPNRKTLILMVAWPLLAGFTGTALLLFGLRATPLPEDSLSDPTEIEAADGTRIASWSWTANTERHVPLSEIPKALQEATLAVEDAHFYHHRAFSLPSLGRALLVDIKSGHVVEGGSTITQQLAKNLFLSQQRTLTRKIREALYAIQLEMHESKDTILNQYLNVIYYGHGAYGVDAAAETYFGKPVEELNLAESAMIAGLPRGPAIFSPIEHPAAAKERQRIVLDRMVACHYITWQQANAAFNQPLHYATHHIPLHQAPYFTTTVMEELAHRYHLSSDELYRGGTKVMTTLDPLLQQAAERAIRSTLPANSSLQAALVALDPQTGAIRAMVGGRSYMTSPYNRVFAERQPGSTFKPLLYTTALEQHWSPARQINSELTTFVAGIGANALYTVHDYGDFYAGRPLTLREALARSDNIYAVSTNLAVNPSQVVATAHRMGITTHLGSVPSLALGVYPTSPLQMATAYATLANGGKRVEPYAVEEVRSATQNEDIHANPTAKQVISPQVAFQMADLMRSVMQPGGTGYSVSHYLNDPVAAKTGTTDTDAWMVGFTPNLVCAVWVGYDDNRPLNLMESHLASPIWAKFMSTAQLHMPYSWYSPPSGLITRQIDPLSGKLATDKCGRTETDYFQPGTEPVASCPLHPHPQTPVQKLTRGLLPWLRHWFGG
ncbi:transglycosylase domain-containing protein [Alicyclobacillus sp. TC]|uniref:transglycosylase domain-containing protein n=1 Tax=Alicyclobacillus sp. TC TaxID=2606450 RepID=UPI001EE3BF15|nr:PBP1A family penicillin-binding protein [Alicyclobacillus sp. TC]